MPIGHNNSQSCPECKVKTSRTAAGLYHCYTDGCPVSHFKVDFFGKPYSIVYCADREEERVDADL